MISNNALESYRAHALFPDAKVPIKPSSFLPRGAIRLLITEIGRITQGGEWVSGRAIIYSDRFAFEPDWISLRILSGDIALSIPFLDIMSVTLRTRTLMDNLDLKVRDGGVYKLRSSEAKSLADSLNVRIRR